MIFLPGCSCCSPSCDCPSTINIGGNSRLIRATFVGGATCEVCMTAAPFLVRVAGPSCQYSGLYTFTGCYGAQCQLQVFFNVSNFPECECNGSGDYCDYDAVAWTVVLGNCVVESLELPDIC
jgi:hypothetical protein